MSIARLRAYALASLGVAACGGGHPSSVGSFDDLKTRAAKLGCTGVVTGSTEKLIGADFTCSKYLGPCACHMTISVMKAEKDAGVSQAQLVFWQCPPGTGVDTAFELFNPVLPASQRDELHTMLASRPKTDDPRHTATLVGRNLGPVGVGVSWIPVVYSVGSPSRVVDPGEDTVNIVIAPSDDRPDSVSTKPVVPTDDVAACRDGTKRAWEQN